MTKHAWRAGPFQIVKCDDGEVIYDHETQKVLLFDTIDDTKRAIEKLGLVYWPSGQSKPLKNGAYEQLHHASG